MSERKDTNPKDAVGTAKVPFSTVPAQPLAELGLAMMEGALKYGRHNYRAAGVRASVYYDAALRHLTAFWEGQDTDPDSKLSHLVKAMACCAVLRDSQIQGNWVDDRPPKTPGDWVKELNEKAKGLLEQYPNPAQAFTAVDAKPKREPRVTDELTPECRDGKFRDSQGHVLHYNALTQAWHEDITGLKRGRAPFVRSPFTEVLEET